MVRYEMSITERKGVVVMEPASVTGGFVVYLLATLGGLTKPNIAKYLDILETEGEVKVVGGFVAESQYTFTAKEIKTDA